MVDTTETWTLTEAEQKVFYLLVDQLHVALTTERGCYHPKWKPAQCTLVAKALWLGGVRVVGR